MFVIRPNTIGSFTINLSTLIDHKAHDNRMGYPINISLVSLMESKITSCGCSIGITWMMRLMFSMSLSRGWSNDNGMPTRLSRITQMVTLCLYAHTVQLTAMISMDYWANISSLQPVTVDYFTGFLWAILYDRYTATEVVWWDA